MSPLQPVYTAATQCQDCYKCLRECAVKAIKVEGGYASIVAEACVFCGHCVEVCPNRAKQVRNDRRAARKWIDAGERVFVSLAPSFAGEFPDLAPERLIAALRMLGFEAVSETALGAQIVSASVDAMLCAGTSGALLSSACPAIVEYVRKHRPEYAGRITPLLSPMLAHARLLRREFGDGIRVVFFGPCVAKKREADLHPELVDAALTFEDLREWLREARIDPDAVEPRADDAFVPRAAGAGALYPVDGGMIASLRAGDGAQLMAFSGISPVARALDGLDELSARRPAFLELLACEGGCVNGPKGARSAGSAVLRQRVLDYARPDDGGAAAVAIPAEYPPEPAPRPRFAEAQIREALHSVGKRAPGDELNCGGCGYDSCRAFAEAFLMGRAERRMCVTWMRKLAEKKTHVLMQKMPSGVAIVDDALRIVECNPNFARFFAAGAGGQAALEGAPLDSIVPFHNLFADVLRTGRDIPGKEIRYRDSVYSVTVFNIEERALVGGIFRDITQPAMEKEQIIDRARQVIRKNLETVQQIAFLMGENAAESEMALNSIVDSFTPERLDLDERGA